MKLFNKIMSVCIALLCAHTSLMAMQNGPLATAQGLELKAKLVAINSVFEHEQWNKLWTITPSKKPLFCLDENDYTPSTDDEMNKINDVLSQHAIILLRNATRGQYTLLLIPIHSANTSAYRTFEEDPKRYGYKLKKELADIGVEVSENHWSEVFLLELDSHQAKKAFDIADSHRHAPKSDDAIEKINAVLNKYGKKIVRHLKSNGYGFNLVHKDDTSITHVPFIEPSSTNHSPYFNKPGSGVVIVDLPDDDRPVYQFELAAQLKQCCSIFAEYHWYDLWRKGLNSERAKELFRSYGRAIADDQFKYINTALIDNGHAQRLKRNVKNPSHVELVHKDDLLLPDTDNNPHQLKHYYPQLLIIGGASLIGLVELCIVSVKAYKLVSAQALQNHSIILDELYDDVQKQDNAIIKKYNTAKMHLSLLSKKTHAHIQKLIDARDYEALGKLIKVEQSRLGVLGKHNWLWRCFAGFKYMMAS